MLHATILEMRVTLRLYALFCTEHAAVPQKAHRSHSWKPQKINEKADLFEQHTTFSRCVQYEPMYKGGDFSNQKEGNFNVIVLGYGSSQHCLPSFRADLQCPQPVSVLIWVSTFQNMTTMLCTCPINGRATAWASHARSSSPSITRPLPVISLPAWPLFLVRLEAWLYWRCLP